jgi:hypothetical protein
MDKERRHVWGGYLRALADKMALRDWTIITCEEPAEDGCVATARCSYGRKTVSISFQVGFDRLPPEEQRQTCIHELLHAHWGAMDQVIHDTKQAQNKDWMHRLADTIHLHHEYGVDALADVLAPFFPLPPKDQPKKKAKES